MDENEQKTNNDDTLPENVSSTDKATVAALAHHLFMVPATYRPLAKRLNIPQDATLDQAREIYIKHLREIASNTGITSENKKEFAATKLQIEAQKLLKLQLENDRKRGKLLDADEVEHSWNSILAALRTKLLAVPNNLSPTLAACRDFAEVKEVLEVAMHDTLMDLADFDVEEFLKEQIEETENASPAPINKDTGTA